MRVSAWILVAANLVPLAGVLYADWSVFSIVFLYWMENLVIGFWNVARMIVCSPRGEFEMKGEDGASVTMPALANHLGKLFMVPFFIVHYGMFCIGHGVFVFALLGDDMPGDGSPTAVLEAARMAVHEGDMGLAVLALFVSHGVSFFVNFIGAGEWRHTHVAELMMRPYGRIVVMHIAIIFGGFAVAALGSPLGLLVLLIVLKIIVDLRLHERERGILGEGNATTAERPGPSV